MGIGGSGLPIVIDSVSLSPANSDLVPTWMFTTLTETTTFTFTNQVFMYVTEYPSYYNIAFLFAHNTTGQITIEYDSRYTKRYYLFSGTVGQNFNVYLYSNTYIVTALVDSVNNDNVPTLIHFRKRFIEFNWLTN